MIDTMWQRRTRILVVVAGLCAAAACTAHRAGVVHPIADFTSTAKRLLVPSFIWPGPGWDGIASAYPTVGIALLNLDSGPGSGPESNFQGQVATEQAAGVEMYGYISVDYGAESLADAEAQIGDYGTWYGVDDIFVDEASIDCSDVSTYYRPLYAYIHAHGGDEILNPGTSTSECYMSATDILDTFEGSYGEYKSSTAQAWTRDYPADRFFNEIYDAPTAADMENAVSESQKQNVGWVYVTNQVLPNPYATLPSYWRDEVATVADDGTTTSRSSSHRRR